MTQIQTIPQPATTEAEVIARLKIRPQRIKLTATQDDEGSVPRHWVVLQYDWTGKLKQLGTYLYQLAQDVEQAGGVITQIETGTSLRTNNEEPDDYNPHGKWRCMHISVSIRTKLETDCLRAAFHEAIRDIFRHNRETT